MANPRPLHTYSPPSKRAKVGVPGAWAQPLSPYIDIPILQQLPKEGERIGNIKPLALTAKHISGRLSGELTAVEVTARLKTLLGHKAVVKVLVLPARNGVGWQITPRGEEILAQLKEEAHG